MRKGRKMVEAGFMFLKRTGVYTCGEMGNDLTAFVGTNSLPDRGFMRWRISNPYLRRFQGRPRLWRRSRYIISIVGRDQRKVFSEEDI